MKGKSMRGYVTCPVCERRFEALAGSECFCGCGARFRVSLAKGNLQTELIPRKGDKREAITRLQANR